MYLIETTKSGMICRILKNNLIFIDILKLFDKNFELFIWR